MMDEERKHVSTRPPSVIERYFQRRYRIINKPKCGGDIMVLTHSNRICVTCLSRNHPIIRDKKTVLSVNFKVDGINRLENKVSGKAKRGAQWLKVNSPLCKISCTDGTEYTPLSCIRGQLIEVNENLVDHPELLTEKSNGENYIAVILPNLKTFEADINHLTKEEEYQMKTAEEEEKNQKNAKEEKEECQKNTTEEENSRNTAEEKESQQIPMETAPTSS